MNKTYLLRTLAVLAASVCAVSTADAQQKKSPTEQAVLLGHIERVLDAQLLFRPFPDTNLVVRTHLVGRDVHALAIRD